MVEKRKIRVTFYIKNIAQYDGYRELWINSPTHVPFFSFSLKNILPVLLQNNGLSHIPYAFQGPPHASDFTLAHSGQQPHRSVITDPKIHKVSK